MYDSFNSRKKLPKWTDEYTIIQTLAYLIYTLSVCLFGCLFVCLFKRQNGWIKILCGISHDPRIIYGCPQNYNKLYPTKDFDFLWKMRKKYLKSANLFRYCFTLYKVKKLTDKATINSFLYIYINTMRTALNWNFFISTKHS